MESASFAERARWTENVSVTVRAYYSIAWLVAAETCRISAEELVGTHTRPTSGEYDRMRSYSLSAVVASWAFLESNINELFEDAAHYEPGSPLAAEALRGLAPELHRLLGAVGPHIGRVPTLKKYEIALDLAGVAPVPAGEGPGQSAQLLNRIRNRLLHYRPYPVRDWKAEGEDAALSTAMRGRVALPAWDIAKDPLFPTRIVCPGLATWSIKAAIGFAEEFSSRSGLAPRYGHVIPAWIV